MLLRSKLLKLSDKKPFFFSVISSIFLQGVNDERHLCQQQVLHCRYKGACSSRSSEIEITQRFDASVFAAIKNGWPRLINGEQEEEVGGAELAEAVGTGWSHVIKPVGDRCKSMTILIKDGQIKTDRQIKCHCRKKERKKRTRLNGALGDVLSCVTLKCCTYKRFRGWCDVLVGV